MKLIDQSWQWEYLPENPLERIEKIGRTCYKSEEKIKQGTAEKFVKMIMNLGHESVIEHIHATVRFITNRSVTHELVRHRLCSFSQESTRYVKYKGEMEFIRPVWWNDPNFSEEHKQFWIKDLQAAEETYHHALDSSLRSEQARELLPHALKTEIVVTANLREWRHIFKLRCTKAAHPQIRLLMLNCLQGFAEKIPIIFDDLNKKFRRK